MGFSVDFMQFETYRNNLERLKTDDLFKAIAKELTARLMSSVKKNTPVLTGTLRREWKLKVYKQNGEWIGEVYNPTEYATYVEYGHRTTKGDGWVDGVFMLTIAEDEVKKNSTKIIEQKIERWLKNAK